MKKTISSKFSKPLVGFVISTVVFTQLLVTGVFVFPGTALAARTITGATLNGTSSVTVLPSASITAAVTVTTSGSGTSNDWTSTKYQIEGQSVVCVDTPDHTSSGTYTESFSITAPSNLGAYDVTFTAYQNNDCSVGPNTSTLTDGIIVANAYSGPNYAGMGSDVSSTGTISWSRPDYITADDINYSSSTVGNNGISHYLKASNFGFSIPAGATINGITVKYYRTSNGTFGDLVKDNIVKLVKAGTVVGSNYAQTGSTYWVNAGGYIPPANIWETATYGGVSDLWGESWTANDINNNDNFGVVLSAKSISNNINTTAWVDYVQITVYYTPISTGSLTITKQTIGGNGSFNMSGSGGIGNFQITTTEGTGSQTFNDLTPGSYTIIETVVPGDGKKQATPARM